jgi:hypothetical protein
MGISLLTFGTNWSDLSALIELNGLSQISFWYLLKYHSDICYIFLRFLKKKSQVLICDLKKEKYDKSINTKIIKKLSITQSTFKRKKIFYKSDFCTKSFSSFRGLQIDPPTFIQMWMPIWNLLRNCQMFQGIRNSSSHFHQNVNVNLKFTKKLSDVSAS